MYMGELSEKPTERAFISALIQKIRRRGRVPRPICRACNPRTISREAKRLPYGICVSGEDTAAHLALPLGELSPQVTEREFTLRKGTACVPFHSDFLYGVCRKFSTRLLKDYGICEGKALLRVKNAEKS